MQDSAEPVHRRCLVAVSSHGFGHLAQVTPVINTCHALSSNEKASALHWVVRTTLDPVQVRSRIVPDISIDSHADDFGMVMHDSLACDLPASLARYAQLHRDWDRQVERVARQLQHHDVDLVLADIPYLTLAAAQHAGIASLALCSLNWADILESSLAGSSEVLTQADVSTQELGQMLDTMRGAYASAKAFLQPAPSMAMPGFDNGVPIGPVCEPPQAVARTLLEALARHQGHTEPGWFVLVSMGGIPTRLDISTWPDHCMGRPVYYLVSRQIAAQHSHGIAIDDPSRSSPAFSFASLFAICDLFIGKPGYGAFVEAVCTGTPVLYLERPDWPETEVLTDWIAAHGSALQITLAQLTGGDFLGQMTALLERGRFTPVEPAGNVDAARWILGLSGVKVSG